MAYNESYSQHPQSLRIEKSRSLIAVAPENQQLDNFPSPRNLLSQQRNVASQISNSPTISPSTIDSSDMLLPPTRHRLVKPYQDHSNDRLSRAVSTVSSRRDSFESAGSRDSRNGPFVSLFDDPRAPSRNDSDDDNVNTQTVSEKYNIMPSAGLLIFPEDIEKDDWLHNPDPNDIDRDKCDIFTKRGIANVGGLLLICIGILALFIGYPIL